MSLQYDDLSEVISWSDKTFYDFCSLVAVPSLYITSDGLTQIPVQEEEATDQELVKLAEKCGTFDFLDEPEEDIYDLSDGTAI